MKSHELEVVYDRFLRREIEVPGKDYCDMAGDYGRERADYSIINVMLPRRYYPAWQGNVLEQRRAIGRRPAAGDGMEIDYDQLLAKQPFKDDAVFAWHQDMAYWPDTPDTRTATVLVRDRRVDGRQRVHAVRSGDQPRGPSLRPHAPVSAVVASRTRWAPSCSPTTRWSSCRSGGATARCTTSG